MGIFMTEFLGIQENSNFELSFRSNILQMGCHRGNGWEVADEVNRKQQSWLLMTCVWHTNNPRFHVPQEGSQWKSILKLRSFPNAARLY